MPRTVQLNVLLPHNRNHPGWIRVEIDGVAVQEFRVLGRGSTTVDKKPTGNPNRDPLHYAGNTPTGEYVSPGISDTSTWSKSSYGPWGAIRLKAVSGQALLAETFGREGLLIHGGSPGRFDGYRSTLGCLRLHDDDMKQLVQLITGAAENADARCCDGLAVRVSVRE